MSMLMKITMTVWLVAGFATLPLIGKSELWWRICTGIAFAAMLAFFLEAIWL